MKLITRRFAVLFVMMFFAFQSSMALADEKEEMNLLVDQATTIVKGFSIDENLDWFRQKAKEAKAMMIIPKSLKGAFIVGGSGGSGVLIAKDPNTGDWGYPAFYTLGSLSVGFQIGAEASEVILLVMTDRGVEKLLASSLKLGADVTIAAGPVGAGAQAATADVLSYSRSKGAFAGVSLDGAIVKTRDSRNEAYYGKPVSPTDILIRKAVSNPQADNLRMAIKEVSGS